MHKKIGILLGLTFSSLTYVMEKEKECSPSYSHSSPFEESALDVFKNAAEIIDNNFVAQKHPLLGEQEAYKYLTQSDPEDVLALAKNPRPYEDIGQLAQLATIYHIQQSISKEKEYKRIQEILHGWSVKELNTLQHKVLNDPIFTKKISRLIDFKEAFFNDNSTVTYQECRGIFNYSLTRDTKESIAPPNTKVRTVSPNKQYLLLEPSTGKDYCLMHITNPNSYTIRRANGIGDIEIYYGWLQDDGKIGYDNFSNNKTSINLLDLKNISRTSTKLEGFWSVLTSKSSDKIIFHCLRNGNNYFQIGILKDLLSFYTFKTPSKCKEVNYFKNSFLGACLQDSYTLYDIENSFPLISIPFQSYYLSLFNEKTNTIVGYEGKKLDFYDVRTQNAQHTLSSTTPLNSIDMAKNGRFFLTTTPQDVIIYDVRRPQNPYTRLPYASSQEATKELLTNVGTCEWNTIEERFESDKNCLKKQSL